MLNLKKYLNSINIIFGLGFVLAVLVALGYIPRAAAFIILIAYIVFVIFAPARDGVELFLRSIPIFIALPITEGFDNFNIWRLVLLVIFLKWAFEIRLWKKIRLNKMRELGLFNFIKKYSIEILGIIFFVFASVSLLVAPDVISGAKRVIYLANAAFLFIVVRSLILRDKNNLNSFARGITYAGVISLLFGYLQFVAAYFAPAWVFHYWWGQVVSLGLYGQAWADIVTNMGNTWFSYSGATLRLRMFSVFPDSHSFPMFLIMAVPFMVVFYRIKKLSKHYAIAFFALLNLALILSGTRGIWLSGALGFITIGVLALWHVPKPLLKKLFIWFLVFLMMFPVYFAILAFPQFVDTNFTSSATFGRLSSIVDFGETSNEGRINIWRTTISFIAKSPVLGIGIGNYALILAEPVSAMAAGASAHNLYLHIAGTIGIFGLIAFLWMLFELLRKGAAYIKSADNKNEQVYVVFALYSLAWIAAYSMTDAALFDGRVLLIFMATTGIITGLIYGKSAS